MGLKVQLIALALAAVAVASQDHQGGLSLEPPVAEVIDQSLSWPHELLEKKNASLTCLPLLLDAFNLKLCGRVAVSRAWQREESAFGCLAAARSSALPRVLNSSITSSSTSASNNKTTSALVVAAEVGPPRIYGGQEALEGEFPFFVQIRHQGQFKCGATLIHKDLLVTAAHCVENVSEALGMSLVAGSDWREGTGGQVRQAKRWCWPKLHDNYQTALRYDLALIKLAEPVQYDAGRIWPACMRLDALHSKGAQCAFSGLGLINLSDETEVLADHLKTLRVERNCAPEFPEQSCYSSPGAGLDQTRPGDSGSPVVCYDRCSRATAPGEVQAFAVAANSGGPSVSAMSNVNFVSDFAKSRLVFKQLLREIRKREGKGSSKVECRNSHATGVGI